MSVQRLCVYNRVCELSKSCENNDFVIGRSSIPSLDQEESQEAAVLGEATS